MFDFLFLTYLPFVFLFGLIIGSFLNCLIWRLYQDESLGGRSYCPNCRHKLSWHDNIPLLSFILLRGRCRYCQQKISWQYPLVELIVAILFVLSFSNLANKVFFISTYDFYFTLLRDWLLIIVMTVIFVYDSRWQLIPMNFVWPVTAFLFLVNLFLKVPILELSLFGLAVAAFFLLQYLITKKKGIGEGDIWLGLLLGVSFPNTYHILLLLFIAYLSGALIGLILSATKKSKRIALGPFLAFGAIITLIWGDYLLSHFFRLFF